MDSNDTGSHATVAQAAAALLRCVRDLQAEVARRAAGDYSQRSPAQGSNAQQGRHVLGAQAAVERCTCVPAVGGRCVPRSWYCRRGKARA